MTTGRSTTKARQRTRGEILSLDEQVEVPYGSFDGVLMTKDTTPLEPDVLEHKFYAKGVGPRPRRPGLRRAPAERSSSASRSSAGHTREGQGWHGCGGAPG